MKIWFGYGSEHSANLVMVGEFIDAGGAEKAKQVINDLTSQVEKDSEAGFWKSAATPTAIPTICLTYYRKYMFMTSGPMNWNSLAMSLPSPRTVRNLC